ncbi:MAG: glycosyltransferase [Candidatus Parabeggiatoa sp. nov. 3]|nr:MAG: glycosyltransferase [Gammaproteobacteria bacterium]RKZ69274.1 MAG: glycosyltransferase [Gammaproteobacteria bacterium]RKZ87922.1 MAG: glycosyltransferase [Gammaproteobacteria bacterium]
MSFDNAHKPSIELSIVVPMYNETDNLSQFFSRLETVLNRLKISYEIVCVNDGSTDNTLALLLEHNKHNPFIKIVELSRNFGKEIALTAGIEHTSGSAVIPIDADLQDQPELIGELLAKWREGYDMVYATRRIRRGETFIKRFTAKLFYRVIDAMSEIDIPKNTGDFRLMDRSVVNALSQLPERTRFMKGLFSWLGFKQTAIYYDRDPRQAGESKWNYWRLWNFAIDGITSFSALPLKLWSYVGIFLSFMSMLYAAFLFVRTLVMGIELPGYASMMVVILFLGGIQLITLGVIGEYLGRIYTEVKGRPLYLVRRLYGF